MLKKPYIFLLSFFSFISAICFAQAVSSPEIKCLSVDLTGKVTLNWTTPSDPGNNFVDYKIYSSLSLAGPYLPVATVNTYTQTSYTDAGANGNASKVYYLIQTDYKPGPVLSAPIDTFSTIFLSVSGTTSANLSWNKIAPHPIASSTGWYKVFREYPLGTWTLRDSTINLSYNDVIDICNKTNLVISYRIEIADSTGCTSVSNSNGKIFTDQTPPVSAPIDTVSVDPNSNLANISWSPSPSPDADTIVIYKGAGPNGPWNPIASLPVPQTSYTNTSSNAGSVSEYYRIAFKDSCGNISPLGTYHKTIHFTASFDICASTANLSWNKYRNLSPDVTQYDILKSTNGGSFILIAAKGAADTTYTDTKLKLGESYCYIIRATNGVKTSSSNKVCFIANVAQPPKYTYNRYVTVLSPTSILLNAYVDFSASVKFYRIQRALRGSKQFAVIATEILPNGNTLTYLDKSVNTTANSYNYKIDAMDSCGNAIMVSNLDTSIHLTASIAPSYNINLLWNPYGQWLGNTDHYEIYRSVDGIWGTSPIASVSFNGDSCTYTDDVKPFSSSKGILAYYIQAIEGSGNQYGFSDTSRSNIVYVKEYPQYYIPNSFTPNGDKLNDIFIPIIGFIDTNNYNMTIFDNTGTPCFKTTDYKIGWNGKKKGHPCMEGVYMYLINGKASDGDDFRVAGTISLFR